MWKRSITGLTLLALSVVRGAELIQPDMLVLSDETTLLEVSGCWWNIGDKINIQTRCYCYMWEGEKKCTIPGPTLVYTAGDDAFIRLKNNLTGANVFDSGDHMVVEDLVSHDPDVTNLHTHGLHVDPAIDDVVDIFVEPSKSKDYNFTILPDHYPGIHWYHDHWHGAVTFHVHTGLFGAIVMNSVVEEHLLNMTDRVIILHGLSLNNASLNPNTGECDCDGYEDWFDGGGSNVGKNPLEVKGFHLTTICDQWCDMYCYQRNVSGTPPRQIFNDPDWLAEVAPQAHLNWDGGITLFMVNGQVQPKITIGTYEWVRLRIVNADAQGAFMLYFANKDVCDYYFISTDGIFFDSARDLNQVPYSDYVFIPMAGRIEMVLSCNTSGVYEVWHMATHPNTSLHADINCNPVYNTSVLLFNIVVDVDAPFVITSFDPDMSFPAKTGYVADTVDLIPGEYLTEPECTHYNTNNYKGVYWTMHPDFFTKNVETNCTSVTVPTVYGNKTFTGALFGINGQYFRHDSPLATLLGDSVYEMVVQFFPHPFHHHINPFQLQQDIAYGFVGRKGDWRDVVSSGCSPGNFTARVRTLDYVGKVVMHCHFLPHEDRGLMGYYNISNAPCQSSPGMPIPEDTGDCVQEPSADFCAGPIIDGGDGDADGAVTLKIWNLVLISMATMGVITLL